MADDVRHRDGAAFSVYWQSPLLRAMLRASGAAGVIAPVAASAFTGRFSPEYLLSELMGAGLLALSFTRLAKPRPVAVLYLGVALLTTFVFGAWYSWTPAVVATICYLVVAGGLLFGPGYAYGTIALVAVALLVGGMATDAGVYAVALPEGLDPSKPVAWLRAATVFAVVTGCAAWVLTRAKATVDAAERKAERMLDLATQRVAETKRSRQKRLSEERALLHAQKLQSVGQLGDGFAHMVSNMLTVVRCALESVRDNPSEANRLEAARAIGEATKNCARRTRELLRLSRPHEGPNEPIEPHREIRRLEAELRARVRSNVVLDFSLQPTGKVALPASRLEQILTNLLLNADIASTNGGRVSITCTPVHVGRPAPLIIDELLPGTYAAIQVTDAGQGMSKAVMAHACEPFFTTWGARGHDGLGLTLVHDMARQVGGSLGFASDQEGTTVTVYLPVLAEESNVAATMSGSLASPVHVTEARGNPPLVTAATDTPGAGRTSAAARAENSEASQTSSAAEAVSSPSVEASPPRLAEDWQDAALTRLLAALAIICLPITVAAFALGQYATVTIVLVASLGLFSALLALKTRWGFRTRLLGCLAIITVAAETLIAQRSYMTPGAIGALALVVFLAGVFGDGLLTVVTLGFCALTMALLGTLVATQIPPEYVADQTGDQASVWFRVAIVLPCVLFVVAKTVLGVFRTAAGRVETLARAHRHLEASHAAHHDETEALLTAAAIRGRAERTASVGRLTGTVAHDLNNGLMALSGWSELFSQHAHDEVIDNLTQAADDIEALMQTLRPTTDQGHRGPGLELGRVLARARPMLEAIWQTSSTTSATLHLDSDPDCVVGIREHSFRRILINLVSNARHALGDDAGSCWVRLCAFDSHIELTVQDTGPGMDAATQQKVFEPFYTTRSDKGTGLGLHSVQQIVQASHGTLEVKSKPGVGCTFSICWPRAEDVSEERTIAPEPPVLNDARGRILVAEDDPLVRDLLVRGLGATGYHVVAAESGDTALQQLRRAERFDAMCIDAVMPGQSTATLMDEYRRAHPNGPVLLISGYLPDSIVDHVRQPRVALLSKPFSMSTLATKLGELLERETSHERPRVENAVGH